MEDQNIFYLSSLPNIWQRILNVFYRINSSPTLLAQSESRMLQPLTSCFTLRDVPIGPHTYIHTIHLKCAKENPAIPLVMLPGMGAGVGLFVKNFDTFSEISDVYAIDLLGFGRSSKPIFSNNPSVLIGQFVQSIEDWRIRIGLEKFVLLGHSFGGYISTWYACQYPNRVAKLILSEPWGFPSITERKPRRELRNPSFKNRIFKFLISMVILYLKIFQPFAFMRWSFGLAKYFIRNVRTDFFHLFREHVDTNTCCDYVFHFNCQYPSGETAFSRLHIPLTWCTKPLLPDYITKLPTNIPIHFIYGSDSWMHSTSGYSVKHILDNQVDVDVIDGGTHHVYAEESGLFNTIVCESIQLTAK